MQMTAQRTQLDELSARGCLRHQIIHLQKQLSEIVCSAFPERIELPAGGKGGARLLSLGELEEVRDGLLLQVQEASRQLQTIQERQAEAEETLRLMLLDPAAYKGRAVTQRSLGNGSCGAYRSAPRLGIIGRMMGWWQVKLSSGCP